MTNEIPVAEQFLSIQGEGPHAGTPAVFLRLAGCNLSCGWEDDLEEYEPGDEPQGDATWVCDSIATWRSADSVYEPAELLEEWEARGWTHALAEQGAHIVLTGGEPTLPARQKAFLGFIAKWLKEYDETPYIEVETNGTIEPQSTFARYVNQFNVSLKLSNSGMDEADRLNRDAIEWYADAVETGDATFKFVVGEESDVDEIHELIGRYGIPADGIMLMPAGASQDDLAVTYPEVAELCKEYGYGFSPRLHVDIWDLATGV